MTTEQLGQFDTVIVGGGQAGLSVGYHLARQGRSFVILDANDRIGDSWRKRWDSLKLYSPASKDGLPGMRFPARSNSYPTRGEMADYLEAYAARFELPVRTGTTVGRLSKDGGGYTVTSGNSRFEADNVVVASGVFFTYYYDPTFGILSYVINSVAGGQFIVMDSKAGAVAGIVFADAWMWSPFVMLLVLAGLVSVPKYLYEAAAIDRVSAWRRFWSITFPYIRGLLMLALLFRTIEAFKLADLVIVLTKAGNDTMTISYHLIRIANEQNKTSEGAAISYIILFIVIVLTNLYLYVANPKNREA